MKPAHARVRSRSHSVLEKNRVAAHRLIEQVGHADTQELLEAAQKDLQERLLRVSARGLGDDTFTVTQLRATLVQVQDVLRDLTAGLRDKVVELSGDAAEHGTSHVIRYLRTAEKEFGVGTTPLAINVSSMLMRARKRAHASVLRRLVSKPHKVGREHVRMGILQRYGVETVGDFERELRHGILTKKSWHEMADSLREKSHFLRQKPAHWAHRIVRTEVMGAYNRAHGEAIDDADEELGDMVKILSATFDDRTGADSYAVHGQIRRPDEPFESWYGPYDYPPNRPNDREIVVAHRISWEIPEYLEALEDDEVEDAWEREGHKQECPPRPEMTTVDLELFGQGRRRHRRHHRRG